MTAAQLVAAIRTGDLTVVRELAAGLATARIDRGRTALHVVTDWPGFFPHGPEVAAALLEAGADPDARTEGTPNPESSCP